MSAKPTKLTLKAYQVGFGDCFLLTFHYPAGGGTAAHQRHVLIDFGSTGQPKTFGSRLLERVAADIKNTTGGQLDVVVATHRHKDHISGFATAKNKKGPGDVIRGCNPKRVLQPWTEDPDAQPDAARPTQSLAPGHAYLRTLANMQSFSETLLEELASLKRVLDSALYEQLAFLGEDNLSNKSAVENLMTMSQKRSYLFFGADPQTDTLLPGVKVHVLGPPTIEQSDDIRKQRAKDEAEFWHLQAMTGRVFADPAIQAFTKATSLRDLPPYSRWLISRLWRTRGEQLLELVRVLDQAMNNTSLILLFEAGKKAFLFPGDAQIENWSYALAQAEKKPTLKDLLRRVNVYKVGHHGSLNATPKSLWKLFSKRSDTKSDTRLTSIVSTMAGKHGTREKHTEVPRESLVTDLKDETNFFTTQDLKRKSQLAIDLEFSL